MVGVGFVEVVALGLREVLSTRLLPKLFGCPTFEAALVAVGVGLLGLLALSDDCWGCSLGQTLA